MGKKTVLKFDENKRKDFICGFHKRKKERRKIAEGEQKERKRKQKLEERKDRRDVKKQ